MHGPTCIVWANLTPLSLQRDDDTTNLISALYTTMMNLGGVLGPAIATGTSMYYINHTNSKLAFNTKVRSCPSRIFWF
jgi:hypothetical protein